MINTGKKTHTWIMNNAVGAYSKVSNNLRTHLGRMGFMMKNSSVKSNFEAYFPCMMASIYY